MAKRAKGSGTLRKRSDGRWEGRIIVGKDENGKPKYKSVLCKKKIDCQQKLDQLLEETKLAERKKTCKYDDCIDPTVEEWNKIWIENFCKGYLRPKTIKGYESVIKCYINPYIGKMHLKDLSNLVCQQYIMDIFENGRVNKKREHDLAEGLSSRSVKSIKIILHASLQKAVEEEIISKNPTNNLNLPKGRERGMKTLTKEQSNRLLEEAYYSGCFEFYYLELTTGLRMGEILALEWTDLDAKRKTLTINKQVQRIDGVLQAYVPKTESSIRTIVISDDCVKALSALKATQAKGTKLMFPSPATGTYRSSNCVLSQLKRMLKRAGLPDVRFHDLRHTCATIALEEGVDIKAVSSMLGHTDCGFTMNTYINATEKLKTTVADKMQSIFSTGYSSITTSPLYTK